jgi:hypothetical protein
MQPGDRYKESGLVVINGIKVRKLTRWTDYKHYRSNVVIPVLNYITEHYAMKSYWGIEVYHHHS